MVFGELDENWRKTEGSGWVTGGGGGERASPGPPHGKT